MQKFYATYEKVTDTRSIVELQDADGGFAGAYRVDARDADELYERSYAAANQAAHVKGGRLERFRLLGNPPPF